MWAHDGLIACSDTSALLHRAHGKMLEVLECQKANQQHILAGHDEIWGGLAQMPAGVTVEVVYHPQDTQVRIMGLLEELSLGSGAPVISAL